MQQHIVTGLLDPMRVDRYLKKRNYNLTQGVIEQSLRKGAIKVNGTKAKSSDRIQDGDVILYKDDLLLNEGVEKTRLHFSASARSLADKLFSDYLVFEDDKLLVINKPNKLAVQGGTNISISVDDALQFMNSQGHELRICHRIDKDTSGLLLIAKDRLTAMKIMEAFKGRHISKRYLAIIEGKKIKKAEIESYLVATKNNAGERVQINRTEEVEGSKYALTEVESLEASDGLNFVEMRPKTGRMHQLRCHSQLISSGIVGDRKYWIESLKKYNVNSLMLHAYQMSIDEGVLGKKYSFTAPLPESFIQFSKRYFGAGFMSEV